MLVVIFVIIGFIWIEQIFEFHSRMNFIPYYQYYHSYWYNGQISMFFILFPFFLITNDCLTRNWSYSSGASRSLY